MYSGKGSIKKNVWQPKAFVEQCKLQSTWMASVWGLQSDYFVTWSAGELHQDALFFVWVG
jgi:hypothetical protein